MKREYEGEAIDDEEIARIYSKGAESSRIIQREYRKLGKLVAEACLEGGRILDIGTGPGFVAIEAAKALGGKKAKLVGLDLSDAMLRIARENAKKEEVNIEFIKGDAKKLPFKNNEFDVVVSNSSLHHWSDPIKAFNEVERVLKKNGWFLIVDLKRDINILAKISIFFFTLSMSKFMRKGFKDSIKSAYTKKEAESILRKSKLKNWTVKTSFIELVIEGEKIK